MLMTLIRVYVTQDVAALPLKRNLIPRCMKGEGRV
jgi:hypothetical protein